jgi:hypothetical protein
LDSQILAAPDANAAQERALLAELNRDRLRNAIPQLQAKLAGALAAEYREKWISKYQRLEARRDAAAEKFARYPELAAEIANLLADAHQRHGGGRVCAKHRCAFNARKRSGGQKPHAWRRTMPK